MSQRKNKYRQRDASGDSVTGDYVEEINAVYVDPTGGNDGYSGDKLHPVRTMAAAIRRATALGGSGKIILGAGNYAEGNLTIPANYSVEGVDRTAVIITGNAAANPVLILTGATNGVRNLTIFGNPAQTSLIQCNGAGTYRLENLQLTAGAASAAIGLLNTAALATICDSVDINTAGGAATGPAFQAVAGALTFRGCTLVGAQEAVMGVGTVVTIQSSTVTSTNAAAGPLGVIGITGASILNLIDSTLNNGAPAGAPNGYGVNCPPAVAATINYVNCRMQNNGGYVPAGITVIPESGGGGAIIQNILGNLHAPVADINFGAAGLDGFENGVFPQFHPGINSPLWAGLGGGVSPFAGGDVYDYWTRMARLERAVDNVINTIVTAVNGGVGVALAGYAGGQIP